MGEKDKSKRVVELDMAKEAVGVMIPDQTHADLLNDIAATRMEMDASILAVISEQSQQNKEPQIIVARDGRSIVIGPDGGYELADEEKPLSSREIENLFSDVVDGYGSWASFSAEINAADPTATYSSMQAALTGSQSMDRVLAMNAIPFQTIEEGLSNAELPSIEIDLSSDDMAPDEANIAQNVRGDVLPVIIGEIIEESLPQFLRKPKNLAMLQERLNHLVQKGAKFEEPRGNDGVSIADHYEFCIIFAALLCFQHQPTTVGKLSLCPFTLVIDTYHSLSREKFNSELFGNMWRKTVEDVAEY